MLNELNDRHLQEMLDALAAAPEITRPSQFWLELNLKNVNQLQQQGYENFKQTIALNYFTWIVGLRDVQFRFLLQRTPIWAIPLIIGKSLLDQKHPYFSRRYSIYYNLLTNLLWRFIVHNTDAAQGLSEPAEGNPPHIEWQKKLISQDLANASLEYAAIARSTDNLQGVRTIAELGAGYGRTAYVFLKAQPNIRYIIADIPPALYIAERYLSNQFSDKRIFRFRDFTSYEAVADELENAELVFLLPHQLALLPPKSVDLFINISSLHEMLPEQIDYYINLVDSITRQYFYMKQWKRSTNLPDKVVIQDKDYPIPAHWSQIYWRECQVQTLFFEALFKLAQRSN